MASACLDTFGTLSNFWNYFVWLRITDENSVPEMCILSILLIQSDLKWCILLSRSLFLAHLSRRLEWAIVIAHRPSSVVVCKLSHFRLLLQNILMKLGRDDVFMVPYKCCCFSARSAQGWIQGGAKIGHGGPLLQETSSSDRKVTATNRMHSSDLEACGKKCCYFWFHSEVKFSTRFWRLFGLHLFDLC